MKQQSFRLLNRTKATNLTLRSQPCAGRLLLAGLRLSQIDPKQTLASLCNGHSIGPFNTHRSVYLRFNARLCHRQHFIGERNQGIHRVHSVPLFVGHNLDLQRESLAHMIFIQEQ